MFNIVNPLSVYVLWHPSFNEGREYADSFFSFYNHDINDPLSRGIGIPVYYRTGDTPVNIDLNNAEYNVIIVLIDDHMVIDEEWEGYLETVVEQVYKENDKSIILPIAISENSFNLGSQLPTKNYIRLYEAPSNKKEYLLHSTTHEICRLIYNINRVNDDTSGGLTSSPPPLKLFISHAKEDGMNVAGELSDHIQTKTALKTFFDANDIAIGYEFPQEIETNIRKSVLLVIHSDKYSSREWCRREILMAKRNNRPIVVVNLYNEGEERIFPYMGNVKTVRYHSSVDKELMFEKILLHTLKETLRFKYQEMFIYHLTSEFNIENASILSQPPELFSLIESVDRKEGYVIYPDPPLSTDELEVVGNEAQSSIQFLTPTYIPLLNKQKEYGISGLSFLINLNIGISISESQNINEYGFEHMHLQDTLVEFSRHLLVSGASLVYGGDVTYGREFNFAKILFDLARSYQKQIPPKKITNYVSYPIYKKIPDSMKADLKNIASFKEVSPPNDLNINDEDISKAVTPNALYIWARSLTKMREEMNNHTDARIFMGGKLTNFKGTVPGIVEEAYLSLKNNKPVFLIGSMGGASRTVIDSLLGYNPEELSLKYQSEMNPEYENFYMKFNEEERNRGNKPIDYEKLVKFFNEKGLDSMNNGLTQEENKRLFSTVNVTEMISLVLKGLMILNYEETHK